MNTELLTGKAKEDFEYWLLTERNETIIDGNMYYMFQYMLPYSLKYQLIIEWLDSVGYVITIGNMYYDGYHFNWNINLDKNVECPHGYETRLKATTEAIKKANEIYNEKKE